MLVYNFYDSVLFLFLVLTITIMWNLYYLQINHIASPKVLNSDLRTNKLTTTYENLAHILTGLFMIFILCINYSTTQKFNVSTILWDSFNLSNSSFNYNVMLLVVLGLILLSACYLIKQNVFFSSEYLLFIFLILFIGYFLISSTNLVISVFILEFVALLIFGKFAVARLVTNTNKIDSNKSGHIVNQISYGLLNALFFQFWANFVSSIFLFFSLLNVHYMCGTSNFFLVNYIFNIFITTFYYPELVCSTVLLVFTTGLFIKLGMSPYQFFKIETYKGVPLFFVVVYTTLYLIIYIHFFIHLYIYLFPTMKAFISFYLFTFVFFSLLYLFSLLFDTKNFKAFLSYSTVITVVSLFIIILLI